MTENHEIPGTLKAALRKYSDMRQSMAADRDVREARQTVQLQSHKLQAANNRLEEVEEPYRKGMAELEPYIKAQVMEVGASCEHAGVDVKHRKGFIRVSYNKKAIDKLCEEDQELADTLLPARKETEVQPIVKIVE